jgi:hypothetical protein
MFPVIPNAAILMCDRLKQMKMTEIHLTWLNIYTKLFWQVHLDLTCAHHISTAVWKKDEKQEMRKMKAYLALLIRLEDGPWIHSTY